MINIYAYIGDIYADIEKYRKTEDNFKLNILNQISYILIFKENFNIQIKNTIKNA